jgi:2'-5' RNA ligase
MLLHHFFALACPADLGDSIVRWRTAWLPSGRPVPVDKLHLTLVFTGRLDEARLTAAQALAAGLEAPSFTLRLDRLQAWRGGGLVVLTPSQPPAALLQLARLLVEGLEPLGIAPDPRPLSPHLTLCRRFAGELPPAPAWEWTVADFLLCASHREHGGTIYRTLGRWPLRG